MARSNPLGKIKDLTVETLKLPKTVADLAVGQAKGAANAGLHAADHVTRSAVSTVGSLVQQRRGGSSPEETEETEETEQAPEPDASREPEVDIDPEVPVNVVEELGLDPTPPTRKKPAKKAPAKKKATTSIDAAAADVEVDVTPADLAEKMAGAAPGKKAAKKPAAKKAPAKKAAAKKAPAKKATAPATASQPTTPTSPGDKLPRRKKPLTAAELVEGAGTETVTPVGTRGADVATNPDTTDTDLQQPGTEPLMDPSTTKAVASEQATLSAAADPDKG